MAKTNAFGRGRSVVGLLALAGACLVHAESAEEAYAAIRAKAEAEATERLDGLNEEKEALEQQVAKLKETASGFRKQFEELLQAQQKALEDAADLF